MAPSFARITLAIVTAASSAGLAACGKDSHAASRGPGAVTPPPATAAADCSHSACGSNFFLDAAPLGECVQGARCEVAVRLVATGDYHINEDYPYKLKAEEAKGLEFLGTDTAGKTTFSKGASDWKKTDEKSGVMTVAFRATAPGPAVVGGTFKLSVCSAQNCQLEQQAVKVTVPVK